MGSDIYGFHIMSASLVGYTMFTAAYVLNGSIALRVSYQESIDPLVSVSLLLAAGRTPLGDRIVAFNRTISGVPSPNNDVLWSTSPHYSCRGGYVPFFFRSDRRDCLKRNNATDAQKRDERGEPDPIQGMYAAAFGCLHSPCFSKKPTLCVPPRHPCVKTYDVVVKTGSFNALGRKS